MRKKLPLKSFLWLLVAAFMSLSCDWQYNALSNSVPVEGKDSATKRTINVYLGVDGADHLAIQKAMSQGAFSDGNWKLAKFIATFPGSSDYAWTRIMSTEKIEGYDYQYYDRSKDELVKQGSLAVIDHGNPFKSIPAYKVFHQFRNGYTSKYLSYRQRDMSFDVRLDNIFIKLAGVAETSDTFTGYIAETDVRSHMDDQQKVLDMFVRLSDRIKKFKANHPDKNYVFTLFSDHGNDYVPVNDEKMVEYDKELEARGVIPVHSLNKYDPKDGLYAIPIVHTRVTFFVIHTHKENEEVIAQKSSTIESVDFAISHTQTPSTFAGESRIKWYAIWQDGQLGINFGFDEETDQYILKYADNFTAFDQNVPFTNTDEYQYFSDDALFDVSKDSDYPDLFYRVRSALEPVGIKHPANILLSCKTGFASAGFKFPGGATKIASNSFHGAMGAASSLGILLSEHPDIPDAVRADTFTDMFPDLVDFIQNGRGLEYDPGDKNRGLGYLSQ